MLKIPLFPLSAHLLPGGRLALRIFEPRYVRMVKEACANDSTFVICMLDANGDKDANTHIHSIGTESKIIDFDVLNDGLLGVTVAGLNMVEVMEIETEADGLRVGNCERVESWECPRMVADVAPMDEKLKEIFESYPEINGLYDEKHFDRPDWVLFRWLELLPVDASQKQQFLKQQTSQDALQYIKELIE